MASLTSARAARTAFCSACRFACPSTTVGSAALIPRRGLSTSTEQAPVDVADKPRWSYTPPRAKAPFSLRFDSKRREFPVNSDPKALDQFYIRLLGADGDKVLSEEVKWLAVTHKSFDQGRRGFNDRLAFIGKRIVQLQASLALVQNPGNASSSAASDSLGREPFAHPALEGLNNLSGNTKSFLMSKSKLAELAQKYELDKVLRWSPRKPNNLASSGMELVLAHTMYALVGAIALEKGGHVANKVAQERILAPLGLKTTA
ncbi:mitochondrial 54S ribosomal protein mL57 [Aspergillus clavatus NRRL 1]|uniref:RNase III domain protein n=1 Tax=Aspergillus clavatus (strain ATCC 1007 / CBS 513.65 / DSM 816 / NCTC 3887 / NRRL 1 / QM 1276 / 107) TaxID=344612 RepID=A1CA92_ASPCL|nr:RNase III domain protein [Aspergillus clavatus NRRL 1]EAW12660.1 RNase III domain protein [Aspergillus clavatus NRRL 1]